MKLKHLESIVQEVEGFSDPKIRYEQYATTAHLASRMVFTAHGHGDIEGRRVLDLGCGCAMLAICAEVMGSSCTTGFDIDPDALRIAAANCDRLGAEVERRRRGARRRRQRSARRGVARGSLAAARDDARRRRRSRGSR